MITLYSISGSCSYFPHLVLEALQIPYELKHLKWGGTPEVWKELEEINPMKQVPTIKTNEGYILSEGVAIVQYLSDLKGGALIAKNGEARYKTLMWLNFISTEIHKGFNPFFNTANYVSDKTAQAELIKKRTDALSKVMATAEDMLSTSGYCVGSQLTLPDYYLATVLPWSGLVKFDMTNYPKLNALVAKVWGTPEGQKVKSLK